MAEANSIGTFILMEEEHLLGFDSSMSLMVVDIDLSEGLPVEIEII